MADDTRVEAASKLEEALSHAIWCGLKPAEIRALVDAYLIKKGS